jgi:hypothetical protein
MSQPIELHTSIDIPARLAREQLLRIVTAIHDRRPPYDQAALRVGLHNLRLPLPGEITVPIKADVVERPLQYTCSIKLRASSGEEFFPAFSGEITVSALGNACELWLQGRYDVPLRGLGAAIDATLLKGAAKESLTAFLEFLAQTITENVKRDQNVEINRRLAHPGA